jgi:hypothetical protein
VDLSVSIYSVALRRGECALSCALVLYLSTLDWLDVGCVVLKASYDVSDLDGVWMTFVS